MARIWMTIDINWNQKMVNEENDCHSHICEPLFSNHSKTMRLKTKVDIHVFSAVEKTFFDMLSLENIFQTLNQMSQTSRRKIGVNPYIGMILYEIIYNTIITSK